MDAGYRQRFGLCTNVATFLREGSYDFLESIEFWVFKGGVWLTEAEEKGDAAGFLQVFSALLIPSFVGDVLFCQLRERKDP